MAHTRPGVFKGQVRGVSHQGQEKTLHLKAGYIDADFPSFETFPLHSHGGPYIGKVECLEPRDGLKPVQEPFISSVTSIRVTPLPQIDPPQSAPSPSPPTYRPLHQT